MKEFKFGVSDKIMQYPKRTKEWFDAKQLGLFEVMTKQAKEKYPDLFIADISYGFNKEGEEGGSHMWTIHLGTIDELKQIEITIHKCEYCSGEWEGFRSHCLGCGRKPKGLIEVGN